MSKQTINIGASPNDGTGTPLRTSFDYTNQNFTELYTALGGGVGLPGATTQVIFNDGGTNLAGDAGLVYNKTTDALTVAGLVTAGSAAITGAATVGTTLGVTGVSTFAAGTAALPALTTTGDTNTGIYYPAADTFAVTTGGTERYRVDSTGLGIGASPGITGGGRRALTVNALTAQFPILELAVNGAVTGYLLSNTSGTTLAANGATYFSVEANGAERMRVDTSGNVNITTGNVVMATSGKGIDFSATSSNGTSELLNDYEEGTWTPVLTFATPGTLAVTYNARSGTYTKIGNLVTVIFRVACAAAGIIKGTASGGLSITGLPFTVGSAFSYSYADLGSVITDITTGSCALMIPLTTSISFETLAIIGTRIERDSASLTAASFAASNGSFVTITGTITYTV